MIRIALLSVLLTVLHNPPGRAEETPLSKAQEEAVRELIEGHLKAHPDLVVDAIRSYQKQQEAAQKRRRQDLLLSMDKDLRSNPGSPVVGDLDGDVTVVEFFDYNCGFCKKAFPVVRDLIADDGRIRYVLKEHPILSETSVFAARAALGVWNNAPHSYFAFHSALMGHTGRLTEAKVIAEAAKLEITEKSLRVWMAQPQVDAEIDLNRRMAQALGLNGTPAFIIGNVVIPGALNRQELGHLVDRARDDAKSGS